MAKAPIFRVVLVQSDTLLNDSITSFDFDDCSDKDSLLKLMMYFESPERLDEPDLREGEFINFQYGYAGQNLSAVRVARISSIEPNYGPKFTVTVMATDLGLLMKKNKLSKVWQQMTSSQIVQAIANKYGMDSVIDDTFFEWNFIAQANQTDYEIIHYLETIERHGNYIFYVQDNTLYFVNRPLDRDSVRTFTYGPGNSVIKNFKPKASDLKKKPDSSNTEVKSYYDLNGEEINGKSTEGETVDDTKLGRYSANIKFDLFGAELPQRSGLDIVADEVAEILVTPTRNQQESDNVAAKRKKDEALNDHIASLTIEMDPSIDLTDVITIENVAQRHSGNWFVKCIRHIIKPGSALSTLVLTRNAINLNITDSDEADEVNDSVGPDEKNNTRMVSSFFFDENGNDVTDEVNNESSQ